MPFTFKCPTCKKRTELGTAYFPFCSERCQLVDLGRWANEEYRIPAVDQAPGAGDERGGAGADAGPSEGVHE
jgi:hypothetical protein